MADQEERGQMVNIPEGDEQEEDVVDLAEQEEELFDEDAYSDAIESNAQLEENQIATAAEITVRLEDILSNAQNRQKAEDQAREIQLAAAAERALQEGKLLYFNPGFGIISTLINGMSTGLLARTIYKTAVTHLTNANNTIGKDMSFNQTHVTIVPNQAYGDYLKNLNACIAARGILTIKETDHTKLALYKFGSNALVVCSCCGEQVQDIPSFTTKHVTKKNELFDRWQKNIFSCCPWCSVEFEDEYSCLMHWFDQNHTTKAAMCISGKKDAHVNDARLHVGVSLHYTAIMQAAISNYMRLAPLAISLLCQRVTQIDLANTQELASALAIEISSADVSADVWVPDCAVCDISYYNFNVLHYSAISALLPNIEYHKLACGHLMPKFTASQLEEACPYIRVFINMAKKIKRERFSFGCSTFKTMARKDQFDDPDESDRFGREIVRRTNQYQLQTQTEASNQSYKNGGNTYEGSFSAHSATMEFNMNHRKHKPFGLVFSCFGILERWNEPSTQEETETAQTSAIAVEEPELAANKQVTVDFKQVKHQLRELAIQKAELVRKVIYKIYTKNKDGTKINNNDYAPKSNKTNRKTFFQKYSNTIMRNRNIYYAWRRLSNQPVDIDYPLNGGYPFWSSVKNQVTTYWLDCAG